MVFHHEFYGGFKVPLIFLDGIAMAYGWVSTAMIAMISQSRFNLSTFFSVASPAVVGKKWQKINQCQAKT